MHNVATVMAPREAFRLDESHAKAIVAVLIEKGAKNIRTDWLSEGEAVDIYFDRGIITDTDILAATGLGGNPLDCIIQPNDNRSKKLLLADMDSTIIRQECINEIAGLLDLKEQISSITEAAMQGKLDFRTALKERVALLKGLSKSELQKVMDERIEYSPGAATLIKTLGGIGVKTALVSGGFSFFTDQVSQQLGFHFNRANTLVFEDGILKGSVEEPIIGGLQKRAFLLELAATLKILARQVIAIGDGANDIPMIQEAGLGIAYHAKPAAENAANGRLKHIGLEGVLFTLGIPRDQFRS